MAAWLDRVFYGFDRAILGFWHGVAENAGGFFTPVMKFITSFGTSGIFMILLGLILLLFKNTRKQGVCALIAIIFGAIFTNVILKELIARMRPYTHEEFQEWWNLVGSPVEKEFSFPSGHATVATDCFLAIFLTSKRKKIAWLWLVAALLICVSRNYLMVHYPTDIIGGIVVGGIAAVISFLLTKLIYKKIELHEENKFCSFMKNACILDLFKRRSKED